MIFGGEFSSGKAGGKKRPRFLTPNRSLPALEAGHRPNTERAG